MHGSQTFFFVFIIVLVLCQDQYYKKNSVWDPSKFDNRLIQRIGQG